MSKIIQPEKPSLIVDITDIYEHKKRKEDELKFYQEELEKLHIKLGKIHKEIGVTETIINMIENEQVLDIKEKIKEKRNLK